MNLPLFPLNTVLFPGMSLPLHIFEPRYRAMIAACLASQQPFGVVLIRSGPEVGGPAQPHAVGTTARILAHERLPDGRLNITTLGHERFRIQATRDDADLLVAEADLLPHPAAAPVADAPLALGLGPLLQRYLSLLQQAAETTFHAPALPPSPLALAYTAAILLQVPPADKQVLLETPILADLLRQEQALFRRELSLLRALVTRRAPAGQPADFSPN
jgi:Lon protease-like protein